MHQRGGAARSIMRLAMRWNAQVGSERRPERQRMSPLAPLLILNSDGCQRRNQADSIDRGYDAVPENPAMATMQVPVPGCGGVALP